MRAGEGKSPAPPLYGGERRCYTVLVRGAPDGRGEIRLTGGTNMETNSRVAQLGIVVENPESVEKLNAILHQYGEYVIGRMGIPYHKRGVNIISVVLDAPTDIVSTLSGKIGMLDGVSTSAVYSKIK